MGAGGAGMIRCLQDFQSLLPDMTLPSMRLCRALHLPLRKGGSQSRGQPQRGSRNGDRDSFSLRAVTTSMYLTMCTVRYYIVCKGRSKGCGCSSCTSTEYLLADKPR